MAIRADEIAVSQSRPRGTARLSSWLDRESILGPVFMTPALLLLLPALAAPDPGVSDRNPEEDGRRHESK